MKQKNYSMKELMNLPESEITKLNPSMLKNNDDKTNEEAWVKNANKNSDVFLKKSAEAINLLLQDEE